MVPRPGALAHPLLALQSAGSAHLGMMIARVAAKVKDLPMSPA
jgi:hypothetical protein